MVPIIVGASIIVFVILMFIFSISKTPDNLQGFYGLFYALISIGGLIAGIVLIVGGAKFGWKF